MKRYKIIETRLGWLQMAAREVLTSLTGVEHRAYWWWKWAHKPTTFEYDLQLSAGLDD